MRSGPRDSLSLNPVLERIYNNILKWHRLPLSYAFPQLQVGPRTLLLPICFKCPEWKNHHSLAGGRKEESSEGFHLQKTSLLTASRSKEDHAFLNLLNVTRALRNLGKAYPSARPGTRSTILAHTKPNTKLGFRVSMVLFPNPKLPPLALRCSSF